MYNKLFSKILDSSIWLASDATRLVWFTFLASMDEDGFCSFASVPNLAHRARVELRAAEAAVAELEAPDAHSADPDNGGRRVERVPGGWIVLNAAKYRDLVLAENIREATRRRVQRHRAKRPAPPPPPPPADPVTECNGSGVTERYGPLPVMQSIAIAGSRSRSGLGSEADPVLETSQSGAGSQPVEAAAASPGPAAGRVRGGGLIRSPMEFEKALSRCAYVGARLEVPHKLHGDLYRGSGLAADGLLEWYARLDEELELTGEPIEPDVFVWLTKRWKGWIREALEALEAQKFLTAPLPGEVA